MCVRNDRPYPQSILGSFRGDNEKEGKDWEDGLVLPAHNSLELPQ